MNQSRIGSLIEAFVNILIGYGINFTANMFIFPLFGMHISMRNNFILGLIYTVISVIRSYTIRRFFNAKLHEAAQKIGAKFKR